MTQWTDHAGSPRCWRSDCCHLEHIMSIGTWGWSSLSRRHQDDLGPPSCAQETLPIVQLDSVSPVHLQSHPCSSSSSGRRLEVHHHSHGSHPRSCHPVDTALAWTDWPASWEASSCGFYFRYDFTPKYLCCASTRQHQGPCWCGREGIGQLGQYYGCHLPGEPFAYA